MSKSNQHTPHPPHGHARWERNDENEPIPAPSHRADGPINNSFQRQHIVLRPLISISVHIIYPPQAQFGVLGSKGTFPQVTWVLGNCWDFADAQVFQSRARRERRSLLGDPVRCKYSITSITVSLRLPGPELHVGADRALVDVVSLLLIAQSNGAVVPDRFDTVSWPIVRFENARPIKCGDTATATKERPGPCVLVVGEGGVPPRVSSSLLLKHTHGAGTVPGQGRWWPKFWIYVPRLL